MELVRIYLSVQLFNFHSNPNPDLIELGLPFTDPIADGPTIQKANTVALLNGVSITTTLQVVRDARTKGLTVPVLFMGYYNPVLAYGEKQFVQDCKAAGVNGFIICDLPPEEAVKFRENCTREGLSYVPLIAPATSLSRMKLLCRIADSFIYVVSRMGVTGATGTLNTGLGDLCRRVHEYSGNTPIAVGFGVSTREHFLSVGEFAEGVVIGSQIVNVLDQAKAGERPQKVREYCAHIAGRDVDGGVVAAVGKPRETAVVHPTAVIKDEDTPDGPGLMDQLDALNVTDGEEVNPHVCSPLFHHEKQLTKLNRRSPTASVNSVANMSLNR